MRKASAAFLRSRSSRAISAARCGDEKSASTAAFATRMMPLETSLATLTSLEGAGTGWLPRSMVSRRFESAMGSKASCAELARVCRAATAGASAVRVEADAPGSFSTDPRASIRGAAPRDREAARSCSPAGRSAGRFRRAFVSGDDAASGRARTPAAGGRSRPAVPSDGTAGAPGVLLSAIAARGGSSRRWRPVEKLASIAHTVSFAVH